MTSSSFPDPPRASRWRRSPSGDRWCDVAVAIFVFVRLLLLSVDHDAVIYYDSAEWRPVDGSASWSFVSLLGHAWRPPAVPAFYALFPSDGARVVAQVILSTTAWCLLAFALRGTLRRRTIQRSGLAVVFVFGASTGVTNWDLAILGESLALSSAALTLAGWLRWAVKPTGASAALALGGTVVLMSCRPQLTPIVAVLAASLLGASAMRRSVVGPRRTTALILAGGLGLASAWVGVVVRNTEVAGSSRPEGIGTFGQNIVMVLRNRVLYDQEAAAWFTDHGMPSTEGIVVPSHDDGGVQRSFDAYRANPALQEWSQDRASLLLLRYSLERPDRFPAQFVRELPSILAPTRAEITYAAVPELLTTPVDSVVTPSADAFGVVPTYGLLFLAAAVAVTRPIRRPVDRRVLAVAGCALVVSATALYLGWLVAPMETARHAVPFGVTTRLSLAVVSLLYLDRSGSRAVA